MESSGGSCGKVRGMRWGGGRVRQERRGRHQEQHHDGVAWSKSISMSGQLIVSQVQVAGAD